MRALALHGVWAIIKRISITLLISLFIYLSASYFHLVSINKFCVQNSHGIPFEALAEKFESFSFLTEVNYIKGYLDEDIWVDPEFDINSKLVSNAFGCTLLVGFENQSDNNIVTIGHFMLEEFGYKSIKVSLK